MFVARRLKYLLCKTRIGREMKLESRESRILKHLKVSFRINLTILISK